MYISSAPVDDLEVRISFEHDRFLFCYGEFREPINRGFHLSMQTVHIYIKLYTIVRALPSTMIKCSQ